MNNCTDLYFLSTIACQIAECIPDNQELIVLATSLTALGDMLSVLAAKRDTCKAEESETPVYHCKIEKNKEVQSN